MDDERGSVIVEEGSAALPEGDEAGRERILREAGSRLGIILAPVVGALDLDEIVLSVPFRQQAPQPPMQPVRTTALVGQKEPQNP